MTNNTRLTTPDAEMDECLAAVADLMREEDIPSEERALRLEQYLECAAGRYCPEVAVDPLALRLRALAERVAGAPDGERRLAGWVDRLRHWQGAGGASTAGARGEVEVLSDVEFRRRAPRVPASFELRFPRHWRPARLQNEHAEAIERETIAWLREYGIGLDAAEAEKLRKFNCAMYGGYSLPVAGFERALLVTQFISLWLFWDDVQVEEEVTWDLEAVLDALSNPGAPPASCRYVAAWADIGRRLRETQSPRWMASLTATMRQWLENAKVETRIAKGFKRGACPTFADAFECRTVSIGMYPTFHLIEYAEGVELPESFHRDPAVIELKRYASRLVGLGNDLGGIAKDVAGRWLNLVLVRMERSSLRIEDAFQRVVDIHNADVVALDRVAASLPSFGADVDALARRWVRAVRYNVHGFTLWEATAERYQEQKAVAGGVGLLAPVTITESAPARPFASARRALREPRTVRSMAAARSSR